jgi:hypothetical protein
MWQVLGAPLERRSPHALSTIHLSRSWDESATVIVCEQFRYDGLSPHTPRRKSAQVCKSASLALRDLVCGKYRARNEFEFNCLILQGWEQVGNGLCVVKVARRGRRPPA